MPGLPDLELDPDIVFLVFLPPLLFSAAWYASPQELAAEARPLALLAVGLVLATMAAVAVLAHAIVPGMSWEAAFVLGAIVGPTDPVSATATFARIGAPARVRLLVEGEALINDGTALVAYRVALVAAVEGTFSAPDAVLEFIGNGVGGIAIGMAVGVLGSCDPPPVRRGAEHLPLADHRLRATSSPRSARLRRARHRRRRDLPAGTRTSSSTPARACRRSRSGA